MCLVKSCLSIGLMDFNSFVTLNGKSRLLEGLFSKYCVNVNVILHFRKEMCIPLKPIPKEDTLRR